MFVVIPLGATRPLEREPLGGWFLQPAIVSSRMRVVVAVHRNLDSD